MPKKPEGARQLPDPTKDPRIQELLAREKQLIMEFVELNRVRREEDPVYELPNELVLESRIDALASILVSHGIIDYVEFSGESLTREVEALENLLNVAREDKRKRASGLYVPPSANGSG